MPSAPQFPSTTRGSQEESFLTFHPTNRRRFLQTGAGSSVGFLMTGRPAAQESTAATGQDRPSTSAKSATRLPESLGVASKFWIDPSIAAWRPGPSRKVHIEYHTSRHMPRLADRFDADEFGDRLLAAHVNGATVFAKDMYGYCHFPSAHGQMHPNLSVDLLGQQVAALRKRKISVLAYYMLTWNPELAERHPEWLVVHQPGDKSRPKLEAISEAQKAFVNTCTNTRPRSASPFSSAFAASSRRRGPVVWSARRTKAASMAWRSASPWLITRRKRPCSPMLCIMASIISRRSSATPGATGSPSTGVR